MEHVGVAIALLGMVVFAWGLVALIWPHLMFGARTRKQVLLGMLGAFVAFIAGGMTFSSNRSTKLGDKIVATSAPAPTPVSATAQAPAAAKPAVAQPAKTPMPPDEQKFVAAVSAAQDAYRKAPNEMAAGGVRADRRKAICAALATRTANDWVGTITALSTSNDGRGVLEVAIGKDIRIGTTNNSFSDIAWPTLIEPGSAVFKSAVAMKKGDKVVVSGSFRPDDADCIKEDSVTLHGSMTDPVFLFRFRAVRAP